MDENEYFETNNVQIVRRNNFITTIQKISKKIRYFGSIDKNRLTRMQKYLMFFLDFYRKHFGTNEQLIGANEEANLSVVADLLNELVSISSINLEQEAQKKRDASNQLIQTQVTELFENLYNLTVRCEQFNDVKQSIRQMNDLIRDDLFMDFGVISTMIRVKLDEVNKIQIF